MTIVRGDPAGFAVDWDWRRGLTVWLLAGRRSEPRFDRKLPEHELPARPASERQARTAARRWHVQAICKALAARQPRGTSAEVNAGPREEETAATLTRLPSDSRPADKTAALSVEVAAGKLAPDMAAGGAGMALAGSRKEAR